MTFLRFRDLAAKAALILGAAGLAASLAAAFLAPAMFGRTVTLLATPNAPDIVAINRGLWLPGEPVAAIYGTPVNEPIRILFADSSRIIVPAEDPSLTLYIVDKSKGQNPLQVQSVRFLGMCAAIASAILLAAGGLHFFLGNVRKSDDR